MNTDNMRERAVAVSVVVPVYNVEKYIERCLDSLVRQNFGYKAPPTGAVQTDLSCPMGNPPPPQGEAKNGCGCYTYRNKSNTQWQDSGTVYNQNTVSLFLYFHQASLVTPFV